MLDYEINQEHQVLFLSPKGKLHKDDLSGLSKAISQHLENNKIKGILIDTELFPGWDDFETIRAHLNFIKSHHKIVKKVAIVSDNKKLTVMPSIIDHFIYSKVRHYSHIDKPKAMKWIIE